MNVRGQLCGSYFDGHGHGPFLKIQIVIIVLNNNLNMGFTLLCHEKSKFTRNTQGQIKNPKMMGGPS